ncbi:hypothetical protein PDESU_01246 [Pontiella desulfatans]|uniref:Uncharacterized protein n=1 Tax=Pontiella desulfatans TaxID=2750659 RepID=A0A6C2TYG8_PONDE|nr:hypothetical protein [Pontiella desulfatans]VGO12692.1 hypothetical protein PDESU_01246 [Pontiella desulfatans]
MLSGIKEIVIIACVLAGLFVLPRMMRRRDVARGGEKRHAPVRRNRGLLRLGLLLSVLWVALAFVLLNPLSGNLLPFLGAGVLPVGLGWGIRWVVLGFRSAS